MVLVQQAGARSHWLYGPWEEQWRWCVVDPVGILKHGAVMGIDWKGQEGCWATW